MIEFKKMNFTDMNFFYEKQLLQVFKEIFLSMFYKVSSPTSINKTNH